MTDSEEENIDLAQNEEKIISNSLGKFKISFIDEIKPFVRIPFWKCNIFIKKITNIIKNKDILWNVEINKNSLGFTYDGNAYFSMNDYTEDTFAWGGEKSKRVILEAQ